MIGYDAEILIDENNPIWEFKEGYTKGLEAWKDPQTPKGWMKYSCVWYSQVLTQKLGVDKFGEYVKKLSYGNLDISGDIGKNNGLTNCWLSSSLEISPIEQMQFINKPIELKLPVSKKSQELTKKIMFVEELKNGWKLYGKTGSGYLLDRQKLKIQHGWFIGWIEKNGRVIKFVNHIVENKEIEGYAGPKAKAETKQKLINLIDQIEAKLINDNNNI